MFYSLKYSVVMAEHFSVYPSGTMLEMSNGYPHSSSPIGGSPSPGPSPSGISSNHLNPKRKLKLNVYLNK